MPTFRSHSGTSGFHGNTRSPTVDLPAGVVDGDLLILCSATDFNAARTGGTAPSGWNNIAGTPGGGTDTQGAAQWRIASSEPASYTFNDYYGTNTAGLIAILAFEAGSFDPADPVPAGSINAQDQGFSTVKSGPSITTATDGCSIVQVIAVDPGPTSATPDSSPVADELYEQANGNSGFLYVQHYLQPTAGAIALDATLASADSAGVIQFAIKAAAGGATDFPLEADPGTFALTGTAAGALAARQVPADPGSVAVTGAAASAVAGRVLASDPGAYSLSGAATGLLADRIAPAEPGAYAVAGADGATVADRLFDVDPGSYLLTGDAAGLAADRSVSADPGSYLLTGVEGATLADRLLTGDAGSYTLSGSAAELLFEQPGIFELHAEPGVYALTGRAAGLLAVRLLSTTPGSYELTGAQAGIPAGRALNADSGSLALVGTEAGVLVVRLIVADPGALVITGIAADLAPAGQAAATAAYRVTYREAARSTFNEPSRVTHRESGATFREGA